MQDKLLTEAVESSKTEAERGTSRTVSVDDNTSTSVFATETFGPHETHCDIVGEVMSRSSDACLYRF